MCIETIGVKYEIASYYFAEFNRMQRQRDAIASDTMMVIERVNLHRTPVRDWRTIGHRLPQSPQLIGMPGILIDKRGLKKRMLSVAMTRMKALDETRERILLVCDPFEHTPSRRPEQFGYSGIGRKFCTQRHNIDEIADRPLMQVARTPRHGAADNDIVLTTVPVQKSLICCKQHSKNRSAGC